MTLRLIVLFGLPESDGELVARAAQRSGAALAADAGTEVGTFAVSAGLEAAAAEINEAVGVPPGVFGPLLVGNRSAAASRRRLDEQFGMHRSRARAAVAQAIPDERGPVVLRFGLHMGVALRFWLSVLGEQDRRIEPVLLHRNPVATAHLGGATRVRAIRQTIFRWHHHALEVLGAAPDTIVVASARAVEPALLDLGEGSAAGWALPTDPRDDLDLAASPLVSAQTRDLDQLLRDWPMLDPQRRSETLADLRARFDEAVALTAAARPITLRQSTPAPAPQPQAAPAVPTDGTGDPLLLHFHIFKNAGTSVDAMLKANFGDAWLEREFTDKTLPLRQESFRKALEEHPHLKAFSSHTASLPVPEIAGRRIIPILFVRHPLLRIASAYSFERKQDAQTRGANLAKTTDLKGYVTALLDDPRLRHVRNFQTQRFAAGTPGKPIHERQRALDTLAKLPFVGLVEAYERSIRRLGEIVRPDFPDFVAVFEHKNATAAVEGATTEDKLAALREQLGADLYDRLWEENAHDLELFELVSRDYRTVP